MHQVLFSITVLCLVILLLVVLLKKWNQPYLVAYVAAGIILGPHVTGIFSGAGNIEGLGELGILLLLFFLGVEIDIPDKRSLLQKPLVAQAIKTLLGGLFALGIGKWMGWGTGPIFLLAIVFSFNSTAVVSEFLRKNEELDTTTGKTVLNILLLQDMMLAPVLTIFQLKAGGHASITKLVGSVIACLLIVLLLRAVRNRDLFQLRFFKDMEQDHELQVFTGIFLCLGFALGASYAGLTPATGSFIAGIYIGRTNAFHWLEQALRPFKIFFVALFFVAAGLMLDLPYIRAHYGFILLLVTVVLVSNSLLSALVFRVLHFSRGKSIYAGALLSQTGEFGLLACSLAYQMGIIDYDFFKTALAVMGISLLLSTVWMAGVRRLIQTPNDLQNDQ